jgi:cobalt-zinc-cadmium efflux system outer membrane protein
VAARGTFNLKFDLMAELLGLPQRPARTTLAQQRLGQATRALTGGLPAFAGEVDHAYLMLRGALLLRERTAARLAAARRRAADSQAPAAQGLADKLEALRNVRTVATLQAAWLRADLVVATARAISANVRGQVDRVAIPPPHSHLPDLPAAPSRVTAANRVALAQRVDLAAARAAIAHSAAAYSLALDWRWWTSLRLGASAERDSASSHVAGPRFRIAPPVFGAGTPGLARAAPELHLA